MIKRNREQTEPGQKDFSVIFLVADRQNGLQKTEVELGDEVRHKEIRYLRNRSLTKVRNQTPSHQELRPTC